MRDRGAERAEAQAVTRASACRGGLFGAVLYDPVWTTSVKTPGIAGSSSRLCPPPSGARRRVVVGTLDGVALACALSCFRIPHWRSA